MTTSNGVFANIREYPDRAALSLYQSLVGIDDVKQRLLTEAILLVQPKLLQNWSTKHHGREIPLVRTFLKRPPLFLFGGDVGTGKTALAETIGDAIARQLNIGVHLYPMTLSARGTGTVGEMTTLITNAFAEVRQAASVSDNSVTVLMIDEADALAQSREFSQMHHEDRAGVNALIRGINELTDDSLRVLVIMCTNRLDSIDPAILRRAAAIFSFDRPNLEQRRAVLSSALEGSGMQHDHLDQLALLAGENAHGVGFTYSDLTQRFLPSLVIEAYPNQGITFELAKAVLSRTRPSPQFNSKKC